MNISYETVPEPIIRGNLLERISFIILQITLVLSPLVFLTTNYAPIDTAKNLVIVFGILASAILYAVSSLRQGSFSISKHPVIVTGGIVALTIIISTFLSDSFQKSAIGQGFELGTANFLCLMFVAAFLVSKLIVKNKERLFYIYGSLLVSFIILAIFQIIRLFVDPSFLNFGVLATATSTLIGKWSDFGIFSAIVLLISFFSLRLMHAQKNMKILLCISLILSGATVLIVNSALIWGGLAIIFIAYGIYNFIHPKKTKISIFATVLFVISLVLAIWGNNIIGSITTQLKAGSVETVLPWQLTLDVVSDTIKDKPLFGAGPNRFVQEYLIYKPVVANISDFWNIEFSSGFGFIPTFFVTGGILGVVAWLIFFIFFIRSGILYMKRREEGTARFATISSFFIASLLWILTLVYSPSHVILFFTFVTTGLFVAFSDSGKIFRINSNKFSTILCAIIVIIMAFWTLGNLKKNISLAYFKSGINALSSNSADATLAESKFKSALAWDKSDIYYQALAEIGMIKVQTIGQQLSQQAAKDQKAVDQKSLEMLNSVIEETIGYSRDAIVIDPTNYYNYISEARVSELALQLQVKNAYENAKNAYLNAIKYNPYSPSIYLSLARLEASQKNFDEAQKYIGAALQVKQNYTEAIFLLSQIQVAQGKIKDAITSVRFAIQTNPTNQLLYFQLGLLQYNDKNYQSAVDALQTAIKIDNQYANARYFLGLSYARLGKNTDAIIQFENLAESNPDNQEISIILANLKAGRSPFNDVPVSESKPEKRTTLPVKERK